MDNHYDGVPDIVDLPSALAFIERQREYIGMIERICAAVYVGLGAAYDLPENFLDAIAAVLIKPVEITQEQIDALLPVHTTSLPVAKLDRVRELIQARINKYDGDMEGADADEFFKAEWAAGAMRDLLRRFDLIMSDASVTGLEKS